MTHHSWHNIESISSRSFDCWKCSHKVGSSAGYFNTSSKSKIYICPHCGSPNSFNHEGQQIPGPMVGDNVESASNEAQHAYDEARKSFSAGAYTGSAAMCRKLLMNLAVSHGAETNKNFKFYVEWLEKNHYTPPNSKEWVDIIRDVGNDANHEIVPVPQEQAEELIVFCEGMLKFIFEFKARAEKYKAKKQKATD
ncbi:MAG TPA: DUF4145 domain-containing protein [Alphaproteobacteria bacterium]|nr:DUF4145 domain-containing protein [Micavibrio sp.]HQX27155.1 DUF4145 domain-containing protein [Alphaproteobacteria bacterium]